MTGRSGAGPRSANRQTSIVARRSPDTICALATPPGAGGIAVIRVSGDKTFAILDQFLADRKPSRQRSRTVQLSWFTSADHRPVDQVMVTVFRSPRSYTGEDSAELSCHGGTAAADAILNQLVRAGSRIAEPGEFTRRAVLAGKLTLSQAEAVADMAEARSEAALKGALARYRGELSRFAAVIADDLKELLAEIEYNLGFDEHEAAALPTARIRCIAARLSRLVESTTAGRFRVEGANVVIIGRPNAGKSSLFNRLVQGERAITSPIAGTTRDRIDATVALADMPVRFVDTAGLTARAGTRLSRLALAQTGTALEQADIIIALFDGSRPAGPSDRTVTAAIDGRRSVCVLNKSDLRQRFERASLPSCPAGLIPVSCRTGAGIKRLQTHLARALRAGPAPRLAVNRRQLEALSACRDALVRAGAAPTLEAAALETKSALDMLGQVDAPATSTDILDRVFARFCVGK